MAIDGFHAKSTAFIDWFREQQGASFHPSLRIEDLRARNAGRGIVAREDIAVDVELFSIPRKSVITVENSSLAKDHPTFFEELEGEHAPQLVRYDNERTTSSMTEGEAEADVDFLDPWLRLIITLMYEYLRDEASPWKPYIDVLPSSFDTPMFWTEPQLSELQASDLRNRIGKTEADIMFRTKLVPAIRVREQVFFPDGQQTLSDDDMVALAHRMGSIIMAYAFDLQPDNEEDEGEDGWVEDREGQTLGMVPVADMLNADAEFNAHLNHGEDALTMVSLRTIRAGEEVINYYGPLPNSDLLRRYGYVSDRHDVHNVVELPWNLVLEVVKQHHHLDAEDVQKALARIDEDEVEDSFVLEYVPVSPDPSGTLPNIEPEVTELPETLDMQLKAVLKYLRKTKSGFESTESDFWNIIRKALEARAAQYSTTTEHDTQIYKDLRDNTANEDTLRRFMAVKVRMGEKDLLAKTMAFVRHQLQRTATEPARKRVKTS